MTKRKKYKARAKTRATTVAKPVSESAKAATVTKPVAKEPFDVDKINIDVSSELRKIGLITGIILLILLVLFFILR